VIWKIGKKLVESEMRTQASTFFKIDSLNLRSLSMYRIGLAILWIWILIYRWTEIPDFFSEQGVLPLNEAWRLYGSHRLSLLSLSVNSAWTYTVFSLGLLGGLGLLLGIRSHLSAFLCWIVCVSLLNRSEVILSGGDLYLVAFLFLTIFLPVDHFWSLSAKGSQAPNASRGIFAAGQLMFLAQIMTIYFFAGLVKNTDIWETGEALSLILQIKLTTRELGTYLTQFPALLKEVSWWVPKFEMASILALLPFRGLRSLRTAWVLAAILMHICIGLAMNVFYLPATCIVVLIPLIPSGTSKSESNRVLCFGPRMASVVGLFAALLILINFQTSVRSFLPRVATKAFESLRADQSWNFYGYPRTLNTWWVLRGSDDVGRAWNWDKMKPTSSETEPEDPASLLPSSDWSVFFLGLGLPGYQESLLPVFSKYLCRSSKKGSASLARLDLEYYGRRPSSNDTGPIRQLRVYHHDCGSEAGH
jgi:hypothetical protein